MIIYTFTCQAGDTVRQSEYLPTLLYSVVAIDKLPVLWHRCVSSTHSVLDESLTYFTLRPP
jgi:hypothetical protein